MRSFEKIIYLVLTWEIFKLPLNKLSTQINILFFVVVVFFATTPKKNNENLMLMNNYGSNQLLQL